MSNEFHIQQLVSYLSGNCSKEEQLAVESWLKLSKDNQMMYNEFKQVWESTSVRTNSFLINVDSRWEDFKIRANFKEASHSAIVDNNKQLFIKRFFINVTRVAAVIVFLFGLYLMFDKEKQAETLNYSAAIAQTDSPFVLPDGSNIAFNKGANINYPEYFSSDTREVSFMGEAFFNIAHNPDKPMIIATENVRVKVLGTSFNLCNCLNSDEITVYLESGKILFYSVDSFDGNILEQIILTPGEKGVYNKTTGLITKCQFSDNNHIAWKTGKLEFVNTPLADVVQVLEKNFNINITSQLPLEDYYLTARFKDETPKSIFESLQVIYGFDYKIEGNSVLVQ